MDQPNSLSPAIKPVTEEFMNNYYNSPSYQKALTYFLNQLKRSLEHRFGKNANLEFIELRVKDGFIPRLLPLDGMYQKIIERYYDSTFGGDFRDLAAVLSYCEFSQQNLQVKFKVSDTNSKNTIEHTYSLDEIKKTFYNFCMHHEYPFFLGMLRKALPLNSQEKLPLKITYNNSEIDSRSQNWFEIPLFCETLVESFHAGSNDPREFLKPFHSLDIKIEYKDETYMINAEGILTPCHLVNSASSSTAITNHPVDIFSDKAFECDDPRHIVDKTKQVEKLQDPLKSLDTPANDRAFARFFPPHRPTSKKPIDHDEYQKILKEEENIAHTQPGVKQSQ